MKNNFSCFFYFNIFLKVNPRFAIDYVRDDPVVVCKARGVWSDSGGPLGHPKVYINLVRHQIESFI
jgi:NADH dehydrogenase (ubiquinone) Fe-S protein 6